MDIATYLNECGWTIVRDTSEQERLPVLVSPQGLRLSPASKKVLSVPTYSQGIYQHQYEAIEAFQAGANLCLSTSTASGKTLVFNLCALELLCKKPAGTVLAIYPLKALTDEQEVKWRIIGEASGTGLKVGRIDGSVPTKERPRVLDNSSVVVATPDVVHAWFLSNIGKKSVADFFRNLRMIVIDEAHTYTGVFGSNAAYLFRRIEHTCRSLGATPRYIAASATIREPKQHLKLLTGLDFEVIDQTHDTSGRKARRLMLVQPPSDTDTLTTITDLMRFVVTETNHQFVTFVDSRKQTEQMASVLRRAIDGDGDEDKQELGRLERLKVYPFRAGYETHDRKYVQEKLQNNELRGVISTSALEMGIDIPSLTLGILIGIPQSMTSYYQRIGRIGRHAEGTIVVVNDGSLLSSRIFRKPHLLGELPLAEGALYLENQRIQYIHAMCLVRPGGEHEAATGAPPANGDLVTTANFPSSFLSLCHQESIGAVPTELQQMKSEAANDPNHVFPLRDCETQFQVQTNRPGDNDRLGTLSFSQVMREAYPGAVYYYQTYPYRVTRVNRREHKVLVRYDKRYTTQPTQIPTLIFPNLSAGNVHGLLGFGELKAIECKVQVLESIIGYRERRGPNQSAVPYPLKQDGLFFDHDRFERNYFTTGVLIAHSVLSAENVNRQLLALILYEAFRMGVPFERQDIQNGADKFRTPATGITQANHFLCIYDQTYGSLRLNSRLMEPTALRSTLEKAVEIAWNETKEQSLADPVTPETIHALETLWYLSQEDPSIAAVSADDDEQPQNTVLVIMPGSVGLAVDYDHEEYLVEGVRFTPRGIMYRGKRASQINAKHESVICSLPIDRIVPIMGRSILGIFDLDSGEVRETGVATQGISFD